ncbi:amino acid ABC transporter permease [Bordetella bronchialis]|uniref:amino acid ABC transporter permease n=1 Tax=Bordetella bronchialis TaxID=463025 RepID=UPI003CFCB131
MMDIDLLLTLLPQFGPGLLHTVGLVLAALAGGLLAGFIAHVLRETGWRPFTWFYWAYTVVWRGVPFLIHLFIVYFGLPSAGISLDPYAAAALTLSIYSGAYFAEIFRACWEAIPRGQVEAAQVMGLDRGQIFRHIQLPQALRAALPLIAHQTVLLVKESALASVITYPELTLTASRIVSEQFVYIEPYILLAACYWLLALAIGRLSRLLARRLA